MRERTTWNRDRIASLATKLAEDPRAMNQDHLQKQPSATKYETGGPSEFAEDVHESGDTWKAEYQGDEVRRNEIGMPEFRPDTFKMAEDHDFLVKKADLAVEVARSMLGKTASDETVVSQALSFMTMSNEELINTANRMANDDDEEEDEEEAEADEEEAEAKEQQAQGQQEKAQGQQQAKQAQQQQEEKKEAEEQEEKKQAQGQQQQAKQAQQQQEEKEAEDEEDDVQKQASKLAQAMCQMSQEQQQQLMSQMQQWMQSQQQPMEQQVQVQQDLPMDDEQLLSQMLEPQMSQQQPQDQMMMASDDFEIELEAPSMGLDLTASSEDEVLRSLFAADLEEEEEVEEKQAKKASTPVRTASTRTVGTRPSQGVSKLGGSSPSDGGDDLVAKLSNLWSSAPDVTGVFR